MIKWENGYEIKSVVLIGIFSKCAVCVFPQWVKEIILDTIFVSKIVFILQKLPIAFTQITIDTCTEIKDNQRLYNLAA